MVSPSRRAVLSGLALVALSAWFVWLSGRVPAPLPASAPPTVFSAARAIAHLREIAQRPHPVGSSDHARVQSYLLTTLISLGLQPQIQSATGVATQNAVAGRVENVIARLPARQPGGGGGGGGGPAVLLAAHYDGVPAGPAAGDDGASVAAILETLRALRAGPPLAHDVIALFTDGEEGGLSGAAAFVREHPWAKDVAVVLNFEGRGSSGPVQMFETAAGDLDALRVLRHAPHATGTSLSVTLYRRLLNNDTDMSEFFRLGQPGLNFAFIADVARYHTPSDDVAHLDPGTLQNMGELTLALSRAFADGPLPRPRTGDAVFFTVPGLGMAVYPQGAALPLAIVAILTVLAAVILRVRPPEPHWVRDLALGALGTVVAAVFGALVAFGLSRVLGRLAGAELLWPGSSALYASAVAMVALAIASACWGIARRWASAAGAHAGALLVWSVVLWIATRMLPGASFLLLWPLLAVAVAALVGRMATTWIATIVAMSLTVPFLYLVAVVVLSMVGPAPVILGLWVPLLAWLLAPHFETLTALRRWVLPAGLGVAAVLLIALDLATLGATAAKPEGADLGYAVDADSADGNAWLVTLPPFARRGSWARSTIGAAASIVTPPSWLARTLSGGSPTLVRPAPRVAVPVPDIRVIAQSVTVEGRRVELRVRAPGAHSIRVRAVDSDVLAAAVDGRTIDFQHYRRPPVPWTLGFVAPPPEGFTLTLTVTAGRPLVLDAIARSLGLPASVDSIIPERPRGIVPINDGDQTVVHRRVQF